MQKGGVDDTASLLPEHGGFGGEAAGTLCRSSTSKSHPTGHHFQLHFPTVEIPQYQGSYVLRVLYLF